MRQGSRKGSNLVTTSLLVGLVVAFSPMQAGAGYVNRLVIDFFNWDGTESATALAPPGIVIYQKSFFVPDETLFDPHPGAVPGTSGPVDQVMNVKISGTADTHSGRRLALQCLISKAPGVPGAPFVPCHPGFTSIGFQPFPPPGGVWIVLNHMADGGAIASCDNGGGGPGDCHDNNLHYEWCVPSANFFIDPTGIQGGGNNTVQIRMAAVPAGALVFMEGVQVEVDTSTIESLRHDGRTINPCRRFGPATPAGPQQHR